MIINEWVWLMDVQSVISGFRRCGGFSGAFSCLSKAWDGGICQSNFFSLQKFPVEIKVDASTKQQGEKCHCRFLVQVYHTFYWISVTKLPVSCNLNIQSHLHVKQILILPQIAWHFLFRIRNISLQAIYFLLQVKKNNKTSPMYLYQRYKVL